MRCFSDGLFLACLLVCPGRRKTVRILRRDPSFFQYLYLQQNETLFLLFEDVGNRFQLAFIADRVND